MQARFERLVSLKVAITLPFFYFAVKKMGNGMLTVPGHVKKKLKEICISFLLNYLNITLSNIGRHNDKFSQ